MESMEHSARHRVDAQEIAVFPFPSLQGQKTPLGRRNNELFRGERGIGERGIRKNTLNIHLHIQPTRTGGHLSGIIKKSHRKS